MGTAGLRMPTAALACLPSALLICSGRRLVWTLTSACLRRAAAQPRGNSHEHPVGPGPGWTCPRSRQGRTGW